MPPPMQKPLIMAVVGKGRSCSFWNVSQPRRVKAIASAALLKLANSWISAPAMKLSFADRMTRPLGLAAWISSRTNESCSSASRENVLADSPCLSKVSQASPSRSVSQRQCLATVLLSARSMAYSPFLDRFDQHGAAQTAADADGGDAALGVVSLQCLQEVKDDPGAGGADRVPEGDRASIDIQFAFLELAQGALQAELLATVFIVPPRRQAAEHLRGEGLVYFPVVEIVEMEAVALENGRSGVHRTEPHL